MRKYPTILKFCSKCGLESEHRQVFIKNKLKTRSYCIKCEYSLVDKKASAQRTKKMRLKKAEKGICAACQDNIDYSLNKTYCKKHYDIEIKRGREKRARNKKIVYEKYGSICQCCGESESSVLVIDHINGGGSKHLKSINGHLYAWLVRNNLPEGFQVLCSNCNQSKKVLERCYHLINKENNKKA